MTSVEFELMLSVRPKPKCFDGEQPTLRDMVFDYYCKVLKDCDEANAVTREYTNDIYERMVKL